MRITYRTLRDLISRMDDTQIDSDVTIEIPTESVSECYSGELRIAGETHDGGLDDGHPVIFVHVDEKEHERRNDVVQIGADIGIDDHL